MEEVCIRNLRGNESLDELGRCVPRDESATATLIAHILGKIISQYLSMCYLRRSDAREAKKFFGISNAWAQGIAYMIFQAKKNHAKLRLAHMHPDMADANTFDVSDKAKAEAHKLSYRAERFAAASREVCVAGRVPAKIIVDQLTWTSEKPTAEELSAAEASIKEFRRGVGSCDPYTLGVNILLDALVYAIGNDDCAGATGIAKVVLLRDDICRMLVK